jgi:hypothetical protein
MKGWRKYQEEVASLFRGLGCEAYVEKTVSGARSHHVVDIWIEFSHFGLTHHWVIECKDWKAPITKEKVLALKSLVEDVGAERGILVAESGFQPGAWRAASSTNIDLTTLEELRATTKDDFLRIALISLENKIDRLSREIAWHSYIQEERVPGTTHMYPNPAFDTEACGKASGELLVLGMGLEMARRGEFPAMVRIDEEGPYLEIADSLEEFVDQAHRIVQRIDKWWGEERQSAGINH